MSTGIGRMANGRPRARLAIAAAAVSLVVCSSFTACSSGGKTAATTTTQVGAAERAMSALCRSSHWVGAWRAAPGGRGPSFTDRTLRLVTAPRVSGHTLRVRLSNRFGDAALSVDAVQVGIRSSGGAVRAGSTRPVTFAGRDSTTIPRGGRTVSDPVQLDVSRTDQLAVSIYVRRPTGPTTQHRYSSEVGTYEASGDHVGDSSAAAFRSATRSWYILEGIDVLAPAATGAVAAFGDSITDGYKSTLDRAPGEINTRYPDFLALRLQRAKRSLTVLNLGIASNSLLADSAAGGPSAFSRIDHDVFGAPGVTDVIILEGITDLGGRNATADEVIAGLQQITGQLQDAGLHVMMGTLTPAGGAFSKVSNGARLVVNKWIRGSGVPGAVADFDAALRDPARPSRLNPRYDSGDHIHPNAQGYMTMADTIDLRRLRGPACAP